MIRAISLLLTAALLATCNLKNQTEQELDAARKQAAHYKELYIQAKYRGGK